MVSVFVGKVSRGFSLVELMVGMLLGILLIGGAATIYLTSKRSYVEVEQVAALSENARFAEMMVTDSLRLVGLFGEVTANRVALDPNLNPVVGDCAGAAGAYDTANFIFAATANANGTALGCIDDAMPGTDVLVVKHVIPRPYSDGPREGGDPNEPANGNGIIDFPNALDPQKTYVMTNNVHGIVFDGGGQAPSITTGGDVPGGVAWEYQFEVFYVRDNGDKPPQLSRKVLAWDGGAMGVVTEDLVEGVENLHLLFGYDSSNDGEVDTYGDRIAVAGNWDRVESVEMFMLIRSAERDLQYTDVKTYRLGGDKIWEAPDEDRNFRRMISHASISLRNMKLMIRGGA